MLLAYCMIIFFKLPDFLMQKKIMENTAMEGHNMQLLVNSEIWSLINSNICIFFSFVLF